MHQQENQPPQPDDEPYVDYPEAFITNIFTNAHFHLELCCITTNDVPAICETYIQGYGTPTLRGLFFFRHLLDLIHRRLDNYQGEITSIFADDIHCMNADPHPVPPELDCDNLFAGRFRDTLFECFHTHPQYGDAFKFRFLVLSSPAPFEIEHRHTHPFQIIYDSFQEMEPAYQAILALRDGFFCRLVHAVLNDTPASPGE